MMAESRRVPFTTLCSDAPPSLDKPATAAPPALPSGVRQVKETGPDRPADTDTVRLELTLFESDERSFPEFSYSQLLDSKTGHTDAPLSRFEEEDKQADEEAAALARRLEEKYGGKPERKKDRVQDLIDIGYGYDDEDSFIDNSEAYDEFVPASITTKFGGFYVNSGVLQFCQASDMEDLEAGEGTPEASKKRKLHVGQDKPKKKACREEVEMKPDEEPKASTLPEIGPTAETTMTTTMMMKKRKKKKAVGPLSVTSMLKKFQREKEKERQKLAKANQKAAGAPPTIPLCPADAAGGGSSGLSDPLLSLIGSTNDHALIQAANTVDFDIDLDSLLDVSEGTAQLKLVHDAAAETQLFQPRVDDLTRAPPPSPNPNVSTQLKAQTEQTRLLSHQQSVPLPEGLPPGLEDCIQRLSAAAKTSEGESKLKFFTPEINSILLDIDLQCRKQSGPLRSKVFTHLSSFLPCSRDTLLKRVKKLFLTHMEEPMHKLKEAIGKAMPEQVAEYEQVKSSKATEDEKEGKQKVNEDTVEEKGGRRGPKKVFKWNEETRECLCRVLKEQMEKHQKDGKRSQELEEHLKTLLDVEVKPLWPKGWMQSKVLMRESRNLLNIFTSLPVKKARPEKKPPLRIGPSHTFSDGVPQGSPSLKGLPQEADDDVIEISDTSSSASLSEVNMEPAALKKQEAKSGGAAVAAADAGFSTPAEASEPPVGAASAPNHSLLDLLADQALAREQPLSFSQELLVAAVTKYKRSLQQWSFAMDTRSPPLPPPPAPQSSPVGFPVTGLCQVFGPQLLQIGDFARLVDAEQVQIISDDSDITIQ